MDMVLIAPAAVDVDALERFEVLAVSVDEQDRVILEPALPAFFDQLAGLQVERQAEAQRCFRVGIVGRRHAYVHDAMTLRGRKLLLAPHVVEEAPDATVVEAFGEALAGT